MGFFDFLRRKEEVSKEPIEIKETIKIGIENVREKIEEMISEQISSEREKTKNLYEKVKEDFEKIKKINHSLDGKFFEKGDKTYVRVNMIKSNFVKRNYGLIGNVPEIRNFEYNELKDFSSTAKKIANDLKNINPKQAFLLSRYFKNETSQIINLLKSIEFEVKEMENVLDVEGRNLSLISNVERGIEKLTRLKKKFSDLERQENILKEKIEHSRKEELKKQEELEVLMRSKEYANFLSLDKTLESMREERGEIEEKIREDISSVKRPLKKFDHIASEELPKEKRTMFRKLHHSPVKIILQGEESVLKETLERIKEMKEKMDLKETEQKRIEEILRKINSGYFHDLKEKYESLRREEEKKRGESEVSKVLLNKERVEKEKERLKHETSEYERSLESLLKSKESVKEEITEEKKGMEGMIFDHIKQKFEIKVF
jgi:hypothetical protein